MDPKYNPLFEKIVFRSGVEVKNRLVMAPMTNWSSQPDGIVSDSEIAYYARRASGVGMVVTACTYVIPNGKGFEGEFAADRDETIPSLKRLADTIKQQGTKAVLQIFHGGRMCPSNLLPNGDVVSASAIAAETKNATVPRELAEGEIEEIIKAYGQAARRAIEAGYDGVEIHGANGYLIQQFFSPHSNRRTDQWGGTVEKRMRFPLAVVDEVKEVIRKHADRPFLIGHRLSPEEPETPGITMADTLQLIESLAAKDLDYLHISLQDFWSTPKRGVEDTRPRIVLIQEKVGKRVPIIGVGSIHTPEEALKAKQTGIAMIALGRELIMEPDWVKKVEESRESEIRTTLSKEDQAQLLIPDPLWNRIINRRGWFPVVEKAES